jgi:ParB family chromosome partitioning protein
MVKRRLGRGLDALFGGSFDAPDGDQAQADQSPGEADSAADLAHLPIAAIHPNPFQPRRSFDPLELAGLIESIQQHGVLQPVVVRRAGERYQLIAGERRLRAAQDAGLSEVPARLIEADDREIFELAIVENLQRTDLNAIEKARAFRDYIDRFTSTQDDLAKRLGLDRSTVSNFIRLLELPEAIQQAVEAGKLSQGHARALLAIGERSRQHDVCQRIIREGLSVRQAESLVAGERPARQKPAAPANPHRTTHVAELEGVLRERLGTQVEIRLRAKDRGQIIIDFASNEEFERIVECISGSAVPAAVA